MNKFINNKKMFFIMIMMIITLLLSACDMEEASSQLNEGNLRVHFIDIGQGDSTLIQLPNSEVALIDGGNPGDGDLLVSYIKKLNINKIDYIIATHPHADHIGGLPEVIEAFEIGKIYMPNKTANTNIFEKLLSEIKKKDLKITKAENGMIILDEKDLKFSIIAPSSEEYENTNNYSIVNKLKFKDISVLFTGDAEQQSEKEMMNLGLDLSAEVLKVGHHGSNSSSITEFLDKVNPKYAVISCGLNNSYGHPHKEVMERLNERNIKILRTDEMGTIILDSDGKSANLQKGKIKGNDEDANKTENDVKNSEAEKNYGNTDTELEVIEETYIGNKNSKTYHKGDCNSLPNLDNRVLLKSQKEAEDLGYKPHSICIK